MLWKHKWENVLECIWNRNLSWWIWWFFYVYLKDDSFHRLILLVVCRCYSSISKFVRLLVIYEFLSDCPWVWVFCLIFCIEHGGPCWSADTRFFSSPEKFTYCACNYCVIFILLILLDCCLFTLGFLCIFSNLFYFPSWFVSLGTYFHMSQVLHSFALPGNEFQYQQRSLFPAELFSLKKSYILGPRGLFLALLEFPSGALTKFHSGRYLFPWIALLWPGMILVAVGFLPIYCCWIFLNMGLFFSSAGWFSVTDFFRWLTLGEGGQRGHLRQWSYRTKHQEEGFLPTQPRDREELTQVSGHPQQDSGNSQISDHSLFGKEGKEAQWCFPVLAFPTVFRELTISLDSHNSGSPRDSSRWAPKLSSNQKAGSPTTPSHWQPLGSPLPAGLDQSPAGLELGIGMKGNYRDFAVFSLELSPQKAMAIWSYS